MGALVKLVAVQLSVLGLYLPPVFTMMILPSPPQTIISLPVHTALCKARASAAFVVLVAVQLSVTGLYLPPVLKVSMPLRSAPDDHFAACPDRSVRVSGIGRVGHACGHPTVSAGIISRRRC